MTELTQDNTQTLIPAVLDEPALKGLGLTNADIGPIMEAAKALQDISPGNLHSYGREAAGRTTTFSTQLLDKVRNADLDSSGERLGEVVRIARSLNLGAFNERSSLPILGPLIDKMKAKKGELVQRYSTTSKQIDQLMVDVGKTQSTQQQRVREYDQMHGIVLEERHGLGVHVAAGRVRLAELQQELATLQGQEDPASRTQRAELDTALRLIDKRVSDLQVLQHVAEQTLPMIRLIQANAIQLIEKFSAVRDVTIPMWRNQFAIQLSLADQRNAVDLANAIDDASNELMRKNAELVHSTAVGAAKANQRSIVDLDTLRSVNETLISTVEEVRQIHREGMAARQQLATEIVSMREDLQKRLAVTTSE
ncbi:MAG: toxic anion resistance protein [Pseudomonadota bacterium]|nr:toxic anion resistance protein [Pseudomonadota bacterium]